MKLYEVTVAMSYGGKIEREVWEVEALSEEEARRIVSSQGGKVLKAKDTLFRGR